MKKVLIIGANSYIGKKFNLYIQNNYNDLISVSLVSASSGEWRDTDFSMYDSVIHLSGIVHQKEKKNLESLYYDVNFKLAVDVAKKAKYSHIRQFILMSSFAIYDPKDLCITQDTIPHPITIYGKSKLAAENEILQLKNENFEIAIIRLPMVYGEGCKGNYPKLACLAKYTPIFPEYHNKRSMIHIDSLCEFLVDIILEEKYGYFYPQDESYTDTCEMVVNLRKEMGKRTLLTKNFNFLIKLLIPRNKLFNKMFGDFIFSNEGYEA
jgi:UDP-glucose 4-epimerase